MTLLHAIARQEGFYVAGTRAARNNNPGNLEAGKFAVAHGATGSDGRFAIFPSAEAGFAALKALLESPGYVGLTVAETIAKFAPPNENNTEAYIADVCHWCPCQPADLIGGLLG